MLTQTSRSTQRWFFTTSPLLPFTLFLSRSHFLSIFSLSLLLYAKESVCCESEYSRVVKTCIYFILCKLRHVLYAHPQPTSIISFCCKKNFTFSILLYEFFILCFECTYLFSFNFLLGVRWVSMRLTARAKKTHTHTPSQRFTLYTWWKKMNKKICEVESSQKLSCSDMNISLEIYLRKKYGTFALESMKFHDFFINRHGFYTYNQREEREYMMDACIFFGKTIGEAAI